MRRLLAAVFALAAVVLLAPSASAGAWMDVLPDARVHVIPTASHVPMIEAPDELVAVISNFRDER